MTLDKTPETSDAASEDGPEVATHPGASVPPFSSVRVGDFTVTALYDGIVTVDLSANLIGIGSDDLRDLLDAAFRPDPLPLSINAFVVDTGTRRLMIDTGAGATMGATSGRLPASLRAAGLQPDDIDLVLLTHLNDDHMGGLLVDGSPLFPRQDVKIVVGDADAALWLDGSKRDTVPEMLRATFDDAERLLAPYRAADRLWPVAAGTEIVPGVRAIGTPGHTPGHLGFMLESGGERMLLWGDIVHVEPVQFARPEVAIDFDFDSDAAARTRRAVLDGAADGGYLVAGAHLPFPGFGNVGRRGETFVFVPVESAPTDEAPA